MASVERLYDLYNLISEAKSEASKLEAEYEEIITGVKGSTNEKRLASQFIGRFFSLFPNQQEQALNAEFDLCEDEEISIRKQALKDLPILCKSKNEIIPKVSDIFAQLLQMDDSAELTAVQNALTALFKINAIGTLTGLFYQIENSSEELVRERSMKFILSRMKTLESDLFTTEVEDLILKEGKTILKEASEEEFALMINILKNLKVSKSIKGYQQLVDIIAEQCDLSQSLYPTDSEAANKVVSCMKQAVPYFSSQITSTKYCEFLCGEILPFISQMEEEQKNSSPLVLEALKTLADIFKYSSILENSEQKLSTIYFLLLEVMPLPPEEDAIELIESGGVTLEFSRVECLLYVFHMLGKTNPEFLADNEIRLKDFRSRLQYFARVCQAYQQKLKESLKDKKGEELKTEDNQTRFVALKTTGNINLLIKDLFHQPPSYKAVITLSWKLTSADRSKRHTPITYDNSPNKVAKSDKQIYSPPKDKFSRGTGQYGQKRPRRGQSYGRGGGGIFRGRGYRKF